jgi:pSer/pThr/pTyr-binding forkhead associated (FHA) protein
VAEDLRKLVQRCLDGQQDAMQLLVERYQSQVFGLCYRMLSNREDAEDATQETFIRVLKSLERWDATRDFGSKNGTYVNGERVASEAVLSPGDEVSVGPLRFEVVIEHQVGGKKKSKVKDLKEAAMRTAEGGADVEDVSQWLVDDDGDVHGETIHSEDLSDTNTTLHSDETGVMATPDLDAAVEEDISAKDSSDEEKPIKKKSGWFAKLRGDKSEKGKLPQQKGETSSDTTEAAVDMLRKMTKK